MRYLTLLFLAMTTVATAARIDTLDIYSPSMQKNTRCIVVTPASYSLSAPAFPVLYLLHGWSGNYTSWLSDAPQLPELADHYGMILVFPDGGYDSWYIDSPVDSTVRYETHISQEVRGMIDYYYHTRRDRGGRAIAGLSMGGHGAMYLASRHPEMYGAVGSICGGLDLRPFKKNDWDLAGVLGKPGSHWDNWEAVSALNAIDRFKKGNLQMILDCGLDDFFLPVNRAMHLALNDAKVPHEYTERPGDHNKDYWSLAIEHQLVFFDRFFKKSLK